VKNKSDFRPESYRPVTLDQEIKILGHLDTKNNWAKRKEICLKNVYDDLDTLIKDAKEKNTSLATFKPSEILDFTYEPTNRDWTEEQKFILIQNNLFESTNNQPRQIIKKLPYKFKYKFKDKNGKVSHLMIEDWEIGQLYWNCLKRNNGDENLALQDVKKKYLDEFTKKHDIYFFLGTTLANHLVSKNPFIIIGVFYPPKEQLLKLDL
jgi:hypothetical protein